MIVLSWNCRGLGHSRAIPAIRELLRAHRPDVIFLFETLANVNKVDEVRRWVNFESCLAVDRLGRGEGICILWRVADLVKVSSYSNNHIDVEILDEKYGNWRLTGFYGIPDRAHRRDSWNLIRNLKNQSTMPWCCIGDFNDMLHSGDKKGRVEHPNWLFRGFREVVLECGLQDLPLHGYPYTWNRGKGSPNTVEERIDRALVTSTWLQKIPDVQLTNLVASISDHSPIMLQTCVNVLQKRQHRFKFENRWLQLDGLKDVVEGAWFLGGDRNIQERLKCCAEKLTYWSKKHQVDFRKSIKHCNEVLSNLRDKNGEEDVILFEETRQKLNNFLSQEECYWKQRAKIHWLKEGDNNTRFFHKFASARQRKNYLSKLQDDNGIWHEDHDVVCGIVKDYYEKEFSETGCVVEPVIDAVRPCITDEYNESLTKQFSFTEFTKSRKTNASR